MKKKQRQQWEKWISLWMVVALLLSIVPMPANQVEAASTEPITIAQGDNTIGVTNTFDAQYWNIGYDATLASNRIQLTPAEGGKKGFAYFKDSIRLSNDLSFNAKYTVNISDSDYAGADGIAFVIQSNSNTAGAEGEGIGYSGITPSVVVEIDTYKNTADANGSQIAIMKNGDYQTHLAAKNLPTIDQDTNFYSVWVDYSGDNMKVYFAKDNEGKTPKPSVADLDYNISLQEIFGDTQDVFVGFSSATGGSYSKHELLSVFFDSVYTSTGITENGQYTQAPKPDAPANINVEKAEGQPITVTPEAGKNYVFYENSTDVKPISSGTDFIIDASMNEDGKVYNYTLIENGVQSERAQITVDVIPEQLSIKLNEKTNQDRQFSFEDLAVTGSGIKSILISFNQSVTLGDKIILPSSSSGFTVSTSSASNDYTKRINLSDSVTTSDVQDYLRNVSYELGSSEQSVQVVVTSEDIQYDTYYSIDTEHYYQYVTEKVSWTEAYQQAKNMEYMGRTGYLATIMSKDEDVFVNSLSGGQVGWLGGAILKPTSEKVNASGGTDGKLLYYDGFDTNQTTDGWYWMNGPEIGTKFYTSTGTRDTSNNIVFTIDELDQQSRLSYFNWGERSVVSSDDDREPNTQIGPSEESVSGTSIPANKKEVVLSTLSDPSLKRVSRQETDFWWNDRPNNPTGSATWDATGYFVEFGDLLVGHNEGTVITTFADDTAELTISKPAAPSPISITKDIDQEYIVTPALGSVYYFYENETAMMPIDTGTSFTVPAEMNTHEKRYYYAVRENGVESDRAYIEVLIADNSSHYAKVNNGIGSGEYQAGEIVTIEAATAPEGKQFKGWEVTSGNVTLADATEVETNFVMPGETVEITAIYQAIPTYEVTITNGTGSGEYQAGETVTIEAATSPEGKQFKGWEVTSGDVTLADATEVETNFVMPGETVEITAIYEAIPTYEVTITSGTGSGEYQAGETVTIEAATAPEGKQFKGWEVTSGDVTLADATEVETSFVMPGETVEITAIYEAIPTYEVTITSGTGSGEYRAGETVMIEANTPNAVQKFVRWNTFTSKVNVTDPLKSQTTFVMPANDVQIQAVYEDLSDEEIKKQLQEAANDLTISKAFTFSEDDTWESVTLEFLMLTEGINNTTINWVSSKTNVISIDGSIASTNRQEDDESVILTATILKAGQSIQKTFLLIVKSDQIDNKVYEVERRPADVQMNTSQQAHDLIQRISLYNNKDELINKIDKIIINDDLVGLDTPNLFSVYLSDDLTNLADELAIEITNSALKKMTGNLEVKTDQAIIQINEEELIRLNESVLDLFFRIVPVRDVESKKAIQTRMEADILYQEFIQSFSPDAQAKIVGTPKEIETNYSGYQTTVTLPLDEFYASLTNLNNLRVYIEHSDGTINIQAGQIIYDQGNPIGFQFTIDKFSTFTLFEVEMQSETNPDPEDKPDQDNGNSNDLEGEIPIDEDKNEDNQFNDDDQELSNTNSSDDQTNTDTTDDEDYMNDSDTDKTINESELPNTASIMFTNMLIGMMLMVSGFVLALIYRKKYVNHQE